MRTIVDDGGSFTTHGNSNGVYYQMEKEAKYVNSKNAKAKEKFNKKPWHLVAAENLKRLKEEKDKED